LDLPSADASEITIRVTASGTKLEPEDEDRLFDPFIALRGAATEYRGTGLGLLLSQQLARLLGGSLRWSNACDKGSGFVLALPRS
jgi:two-component system sensor histidine kinase/response regulator